MAQCSLILAGKSSVHLEAMALGCPTVYVPQLDSIEGLSLKFIDEGGLK